MAFGFVLIGCQYDEPGSEQLLLEEKLRSHEWVMFYDDGSASITYQFGDKNIYTETRTSADDGEVYSSKTRNYFISGQSLTIDGYEFTVTAIEEHKIELIKKSDGTISILWDYSDSEYILSQIIGDWEFRFDFDPTTYYLLSLNTDGSYEKCSSYNFKDIQVTEFGSYKIEKTRIYFDGKEDGVSVNYSQQLMLLGDNKACFGKSNYTKITDGVGNPPLYTTQSKYFKEITTGSWVCFKKSPYSFEYPEVFVFNPTSLECTQTYYSEYEAQFKTIIDDFAIQGNKLYESLNFWGTDSYFLIEEDSKGINLKYYSLGLLTENYCVYHYTEAKQFYLNHLVGEWEYLSGNGNRNYIRFNDDGSYEFKEYTSSTDSLFEINGNVTLDLFRMTVTHDTYTGQQDAVNEGYIWQPETCLISVFELDDEKVLHIFEHNSLRGHYNKINN